MRQDAFRRRVLRRVASARGIPLDDLVKSDDRDIIEKFWRLLKLRDLEIFSEDALNDCQATINRMEQRIKRNSRYNLMKKLENDGYFDIAKGKYLRIEPFFYFLWNFKIIILAKERDPVLYEQVVGRDGVGRPDTMKFSEVLIRSWMQERDPDTGLRKIDQPFLPGKNFLPDKILTLGLLGVINNFNGKV